MTPERYRSLATQAVALDVETWAIQAGLLAPRLVCGSVAWLDGEVHHARQVECDAREKSASLRAAGNDWSAHEVEKQADAIRDQVAGRVAMPGELLDKDRAAGAFVAMLRDPARVIVGANVAYDVLVLAVYLAARGYDAMPEIFRAYEEGRIIDIQIVEALHAVAEGTLGMDPRTGGPLVNPETGRRGRYSLAILVDIVLGRTDAKVNDEWRTRYGVLDGVPLDQWPETARAYPVDDARNTIEVLLAQAGAWPRVAPHHDWVPPGVCSSCGSKKPSDPCRVARPSRNLCDVANQCYTAFALHLGASWGFRVDQASVDAIEADACYGRAEAEQPFVAAGFIRADGTEDRSVLKRAIAIAYGASQPCPVCAGTGKVASRANPRSKIVCCEFAPDDPSKDAEKIKTCDGTGLLLDANVPRSDKDGVSFGRDIKNESGDEQLMALADHQEDAKVLTVYVPYLRRAREPDANHAGPCPDQGGCTGSHRDIPLTLWPNTILETGRVSYGGCIQLFPRKSGHWRDMPDGGRQWIPSLRECIVARPGYVFSSEDYEAGELVTHAQSCLWIVGRSKLADALRDQKKIHDALGASMIGLAYDEFARRLGGGDKDCKSARQAAKPGNFGFPGGMGDVKMVLTQRRQGPDTPHASGPHMIDPENTGKPVRGYKGLRFCILMNGASYCGGDKRVREWGRPGRERPIPPTCRECIECAGRLKGAWLETWPENHDYFAHINACVDEGQMITEAMLARWPHLRGWYCAGERLAPGEIMQHWSGRIRGGADYCALANGYFQGLLGDISKAALRRVARECYDATVRIDAPHALADRSAYHGGPSPLLGSRPIGFFHDELFAEHHEDAAHDGATRISEIMVEEMVRICPDLKPAAKAEPTLMRRWNKAAAPRWLKGGKKKTGPDDRLVPWEPEQKAAA